MSEPLAPAGAEPSLSEHELRTLLENASDVVFRGSNEGRFEWLSPSVTRLIGWRPDELVGQRFMSLLHPSDLEPVRSAQEALLAGEPRSFEVRVRTIDGSYRWIAAHVRPMVDEAGAVVGRCGGWRDIHQEVAGRQQLARAVGQMRAALDSMLDPYMVLAALRDGHGQVIDFIGTEVNDAACRFMQASREQMTNVTFGQGLPEGVGAAYVATLAEVLESGTPFVRDAMGIGNGPGGTMRQYDIRAARIDDEHLSFTWRDVTSRLEHERTQAALASMQALADERNRVARDLHDGAIQQVYATGMLLQALATQLPTERAAAIERILDAHDDVIRQMRATVLGLVHPDLDDVTPSEAVAATLAEAERGLEFRAVMICSEGLDELDDALVLQHVLFSLREMLSNVARHAEATAVTVSITVDESSVALIVTDNGIGVNHQSTRGYGLANLGRRAALLDGEFILEPAPGRGTRATWMVPRPTSPADSIAHSCAAVRGTG